MERIWNRFGLIAFLWLSFSLARAQYDVVPLPQSIQMQKGEPFVLNADVQILAGEGLQREAEFLRQYLKEVTGIDLTIAQKRIKKVRYIDLTVSPKVTEPEGYVMTVSANGITIAGGSAAGVFYGIQTLRKSLVSIDKAAATSSIFHHYRRSAFLLARDAFGLLPPFLVSGFCQEVHRPVGAAQYERVPLAPH